MATLVFRLNNVPDAEANAVRALLTDHHIDFYETSSGNWGFSVAGIWIKNNDDKGRARELIDDYQQHLLPAAEEAESFFHFAARQPLRVILYIGIVLFILYFSLMPFIGIGG